MCQQISVELPNIKFNKDLSRVPEVVMCGQKEVVKANFTILSCNMPNGTEENHKLPVRISGNAAKL
jgi:hypothetical protein